VTKETPISSMQLPAALTAAGNVKIAIKNVGASS
jgi:hypothetical protein